MSFVLPAEGPASYRSKCTFAWIQLVSFHFSTAECRSEFCFLEWLLVFHLKCVCQQLFTLLLRRYIKKNKGYSFLLQKNIYWNWSFSNLDVTGLIWLTPSFFSIKKCCLCQMQDELTKTWPSEWKRGLQVCIYSADSIILSGKMAYYPAQSERGDSEKSSSTLSGTRSWPVH